MVRLFLILILLLIPVISSADETEDQLKTFLQSRQVIARVYFNTVSSQLTLRSQKKLDATATKLKELAGKDYLLRAEGFASPEGSERKNVNLSMYRAMAVRNYLKDQHGLNLDLFLTGYGVHEKPVGTNSGCRVDIAAYAQPDAVAVLFGDQSAVAPIIVK